MSDQTRGPRTAQEVSLVYLHRRSTWSIVVALGRWFLWSPLRLALAVLALLVISGLGARRLWETRPEAVDVRRVGERIEVLNPRGFVFRSILLPHQPQPEFALSDDGRRDPSLLADSDGRNRWIIAIHGSESRDHDSLSVFTVAGERLWAGKPGDAVGGPDSIFADHRWFQPRIVADGVGRRQVALTIGRSRSGSLALLHALTVADDGQVLFRGSMWNQGHIDRLIKVDGGAGRDALVFALGFDHTRRIPGLPDRGAGLAVLLDVAEMARGPGGRRWGDVPYLLSSEALKQGVCGAWRFAKDRWSVTAPRVPVTGVSREGPERVDFTVMAVTAIPGSAVVYSFYGKSLERPDSVVVSIPSGTEQWIRASNPRVNADSIRIETARLRRLVEALGPDGWTPVESPR